MRFQTHTQLSNWAHIQIYIYMDMAFLFCTTIFPSWYLLRLLHSPPVLLPIEVPFFCSFLKVSRLRITFILSVPLSSAKGIYLPAQYFSWAMKNSSRLQKHFAAISALGSVCLTIYPQGSWLRSLFAGLPQPNLMYFQYLCHLDLDPWSYTQDMVTH